MSLCDNCMNYPCTHGVSVMLKSCPAFFPIPKPPTNGDRIRQMSDEELLDEFIRIYNELPRYSDSWSWLKEWLKQEDET